MRSGGPRKVRHYIGPEDRYGPQRLLLLGAPLRVVRF